MLRSFPSVCTAAIKQQWARKASFSTLCPLTSNLTFPKSNEPVNASQSTSTICTTAGKHAQKSLSNGYFTSAQTLPKANPAERLKNLEVPPVMHLWSISIGLLEIRPQTAYITKTCPISALRLKTNNRWRAAQAAFLAFAQGRLHKEEFA